jgi:tetratricopeptide (TPR) repeat protein
MFSPVWGVVFAFELIALPGAFCQDNSAPARNASLGKARAALERQDFDAAIKSYEEALVEAPQDHTALLGLAHVYYYAGQPQSALDTYGELLRRDPNDWEAHLGIGQVSNFLRNYRQAEQHLRIVFRQYPENVDAIWTLSRTYIYENRLDDASELLRNTVRQHTRDYRLWESLGEVELKEGHRESARRDLERALELNANATRSAILLKPLDGNEREKGAASSFRVLEFRTSVRFLHDDLGNSSSSSPQQLLFGYGTLWRSRFLGEYRRFGSSQDRGPIGSAAMAIFNNSNELRVTNSLTLEAEGGVARFFNIGISRPTYSGGLTISPLSNLRLSTHYGQSIVAPTWRASSFALTRRGWNASLAYKWQENTIELSYHEDRFRDGNFTRGGTAEVRRRLWHGPLDLTVGYKLDSFSFSRLDLFHGYFSPKRFLAQSGIVNLNGSKGRMHFDFEFAFGREGCARPVTIDTLSSAVVARRASSWRGLVEARSSFDLSRQLSLRFSLLSFHTALSSGSGSYSASVFLFGLTRRF